tara:strand:+ start:346 stop:651 length:306 start_codon:yes stop_codon:yes gene_type:complete
LANFSSIISSSFSWKVGGPYYGEPLLRSISIAKHMSVALMASSKRPKVMQLTRKDRIPTDISGMSGSAPLVFPTLVSPQKISVLIAVMKTTPMKMKNPPMS